MVSRCPWLFLLHHRSSLLRGQHPATRPSRLRSVRPLWSVPVTHQFPGPAWQTYDVAFRKDAAASGLADWSKMNLDLYNFHRRTSGVPQSSPSLLGTQSAFPLPPLSSAPNSPSLPVPRSSTSVYYCRSWNNGACRWTLGQCRFRHVCERCDGDHPLVSCPFRANKGMQPDLTLSFHPVANTAGADILVAMTTAAASCVNSVNTSSSDVLGSAVGLFPRRQTGLPTVQLPQTVSQVQNMAPSLYLPLLPPHKVSPIRVDRLRKEASAHPDPRFVDYVLMGIQEGFRVGFNPGSVSLKSAWQNMPPASLQLSVIDDYLQTELAKGRQWLALSLLLRYPIFTSADLVSFPKNISLTSGI